MPKSVFAGIIVSVDLLAKMENIRWYQLLKCKNLLLFFVIYDSKWWVSVFWTAGCNKKAIWRQRFGLKGTVMSFFVTIHRLIVKVITRLIDNENYIGTKWSAYRRQGQAAPFSHSETTHLMLTYIYTHILKKLKTKKTKNNSKVKNDPHLQY